MEAVLRCIHNVNPCGDALEAYLRVGDINERSSKGLTLLAFAIHVFISHAGSLKNIDLLLQRGADPHLDGSFAVATSFGNHSGLVKLLVGAPKFNPRYLNIKCLNGCTQHYLFYLNAFHKKVVEGGLPFLMSTLVPRLSWPLPSVLLKSLSPADRLLFESLVAEETQAPHHVRCVFFNRESAAERLPTTAARHVSSFLLLPAAELHALGDYKRLLNF